MWANLHTVMSIMRKLQNVYSRFAMIGSINELSMPEMHFRGIRIYCSNVDVSRPNLFGHLVSKSFDKSKFFLTTTTLVIVSDKPIQRDSHVVRCFRHRGSEKSQCQLVD